MSDRKNPSLPFESSDAAEQKLWQALGDLPQAEPGANLRRSFYNELEKANSLSWGGRIRAWLGLSTNAGWVTATACLLIGLACATPFPTEGLREGMTVAELPSPISAHRRPLDRLRSLISG